MFVVVFRDFSLTKFFFVCASLKKKKLGIFYFLSFKFLTRIRLLVFAEQSASLFIDTF
jgi:hypothetical protein